MASSYSAAIPLRRSAIPEHAHRARNVIIVMMGSTTLVDHAEQDILQGSLAFVQHWTQVLILSFVFYISFSL